MADKRFEYHSDKDLTTQILELKLKFLFGIQY